MKIVVAFCLSLILAACSTGGEVSNLDQSLAEIKSQTQSFFNNTLQESGDSGRDYVSGFFRPAFTKGRIESPRTEDKIRALAKIRFVGNERPYTIITSVEVQALENSTWVERGSDRKLSEQLATLLSDYIHTRRDKNVIDHFRSF